jgi:transposase-like protein
MDLTPADEASARAERRCPHCADTHIHRWGKPGGSQRYRCRSCGRTFNSLTGTSCARLRRAELWIDYRAAIVEQLSIRQAANRCGINPSTAVRWRRRLARPISPETVPTRAAPTPSTGARPDNVDFVDWVHAMRAKEDGGSMQAHVDHMFGLGTRRAAPVRLTERLEPHAVSGRGGPASRRDGGE